VQGGASATLVSVDTEGGPPVLVRGLGFGRPLIPVLPRHRFALACPLMTEAEDGIGALSMAHGSSSTQPLRSESLPTGRSVIEIHLSATQYLEYAEVGTRKP